MGFYQVDKEVSDMTIDDLCRMSSNSYFLWVDTEGEKGCDCGGLHQYCENGDVGDEYDVYQKLLLYSEWEYVTREELESYVMKGLG